ncbi:MAG TPA: OB-fold domain-containing protein [Phycisphaerae bacterium]|nr:OB-fold domain-containing protein [Phycisphaerae bacterium]
MPINWPTTTLETWSTEPLGVKNPKTWAHFHSYGGWGRFFLGLQQRKLLATRCTNPGCGEKRLWLPPRCQCPDCWHDMEWLEAPQVGRVYTWSVIKYPGELFKLPADTPLISVEIEGVCTKLMSWLKDGRPQIGMPVRAVFNTERPTNSIPDLAWAPA